MYRKVMAGVCVFVFLGILATGQACASGAQSLSVSGPPAEPDGLQRLDELFADLTAVHMGALELVAQQQDEGDLSDCEFLKMMRSYYILLTLVEIRPVLRDLIGIVRDLNRGETPTEFDEDVTLGDIRTYIQYIQHAYAAVLEGSTNFANVVLLQQQYRNCKR
ncbi:MAG: hypothetical protein GY868_19185 [Deltaproteobacteria bacterium]|nr:hypothetical protein [Deltaproteobacteria bacterium]